MREIKFHGKRKDNGEWVAGYLAAYDLICPSYPEDTLNATGEYYGQVPYVGFVEVVPETVGQFVMWDKHNAEVYEGSICHARNELHNGKEGLYTVAWYENGFYFVDRYGDPWHPDNLDGIEVVGDINDYPEITEIFRKDGTNE